MKAILGMFGSLVASVFFLTSCAEEVREVHNQLRLPGHWLMTESENNDEISNYLEKESVVLTFKDGKAAFSPTDSVKGRAVFALLSECTAGPRPYELENNDIVFGEVTGCETKRVTVEQLNGDRLKFTDPDDPAIKRTFDRISEETFERLVKEGDRRP